MMIRSVRESDYFEIVPVVNEWWGGRQIDHLLQRLFFVHFQNTSFVMEEEGRIVAFLIGFVSQSQADEAYIHFAGVHPDYRDKGMAKQLYDRFFGQVHELGCCTVRCITSAVNEGSIQFHMKMGFTVSFEKDYEGEGRHYISFAKRISI
ncbi:GNAT family N-acetyltransferase [Paenibacillus pinisoli]|uniref:GNAT family N-acetyltransferase n=1 Tax=Paenibacillus pinisoli TaxID=1276110 RepID=A0A3A6PLA1_9BACL|nr:GNAT family N-acetyltransferase [Paenibacillus pinisoli]RJX40098.1 GNAT family N-acetyltransferase [Paenibacillus pinisoli]